MSFSTNIADTRPVSLPAHSVARPRSGWKGASEAMLKIDREKVVAYLAATAVFILVGTGLVAGFISADREVMRPHHPAATRQLIQNLPLLAAPIERLVHGG
jgi:hypothetical protein